MNKSSANKLIVLSISQIRYQFCENQKVYDLNFAQVCHINIHLLSAVPPHQLLIYDSAGQKVENVVGPYQIGVQFVLSCEVRGGKSN